MSTPPPSSPSASPSPAASDAWPLTPPEPDAVTAPWWDATREDRLTVQRCRSCGHDQLYPRALCTACGATDLDLADAAGTGTVVSHTTVHRAPTSEIDPPYVVAIVSLDEGPRLLTHLLYADPDADHCDAPVTLAWRDLADGRRLPVFTLA